MFRFVPGCRCEVVFLSIFICVDPLCSPQEAIAGAAASSQTTGETREHGDILQFINVPATALPEHVRLVEGIRTAPLIPVAKNPNVLVDPQRIWPVAMYFGIRDASDLGPVRAAAVAMYQDRDPANEIGVYGICFSDNKTAAKRFKKLAKAEEDSPFILQGPLLLYIWKDDRVSDSAFEAIRDYFRKAKFKPRVDP